MPLIPALEKQRQVDLCEREKNVFSLMCVVILPVSKSVHHVCAWHLQRAEKGFHWIP